MKKTAIFVATGAFAGYAPAAPGTAGSILAAGLLLLIPDFRTIGYFVVTSVLCGVGVWAASLAERYFQKQDAQQIVIDEMAGMFVSVLWLPAGWKTCLLALLLFRIFDISKPAPVRQAEKAGGALARFGPLRNWAAHYGGGLGIMLDDIVAGIYANFSAHLILWALDFA